VCALLVRTFKPGSERWWHAEAGIFDHLAPCLVGGIELGGKPYGDGLVDELAQTPSTTLGDARRRIAEV
jgi:hypothetical protein